MPRYATTWVDYRLPTGQEFGVAVCGYSGKVRHMTIGLDPLRHLLVRFVDVEENACQAGDHCLALDCPLNHTELEHLAHMLDMQTDEPTDEKTFEIWGTTSTVEVLVKLAKEMNEAIPQDLREGNKLYQQD